MVRTEAEIAAAVNSFVNVLLKTIPVEQVIFFGSYAEGNPHSESDIDVAVVSPVFGTNPWEDRKRLYQAIIFNDLDPLIEPHPFSSLSVQSQSPLLAEVMRKGKTIYPSS